MQERRRFIRFNVEECVILKREGGSTKTIKADLVDISFAGIGVYTQEKMELNTLVKFELITRLWESPVVGEGKVVHVVETKRFDQPVFRLGISFTNINKEPIQHILNHVQNEICEGLKKKRRF